jgi:uncharacterized protein YndB with AHSA1/START domain
MTKLRLRASTRAALYEKLEIVIAASPKEVWRILTDIDNWPTWHKGIQYAKLHEPFGEDVAFDWKTKGIRIGSRIVQVEKNHSVGWIWISMRIVAKHLWTIAPQGKGTLLITEESLDGRMANVLKLFMPSILKKRLGAWLEYIKAVAER